MDQQSMNVVTLLEALSVCECSFDANRMANMIQYIMQSNQTLSARIPASWVFSALRSAVHNLKAKPKHDVLALFQTAFVQSSTKQKIS